MGGQERLRKLTGSLAKHREDGDHHGDDHVEGKHFDLFREVAVMSRRYESFVQAFERLKSEEERRDVGLVRV